MIEQKGVMHLQNYYESETIELKSKYNDTIVKEIVAFLNAGGGTIYIGVKDDGEIVGVETIDESLRKIGDIISSQIEPVPSELIKTSVLFEDGKPVIEICIAKGFHSLYCIKKYGFSQAGCPIRIGTSCHEMSVDQISCRYQKRFESSKDYMVLRRSSYGDLSFDTLQMLLANHGYHINKNSFDNNYHLKNESGGYNQLAELMSDRNMVPLILVKFRGQDKASISERTDYGRCSIITGYYNIKNRLIAENICMTDTTTRPRKDMYLYNMDAVDEALINAIVHNDWSITEPLVSLFEDRLEIISHGGLPYNQTKEQFFQGISIPRNEALMRIFQDLDITEHTGHGIPNILAAYGEGVFQITEHYINVVIPFNKDVLANHCNINGNINGNINIILSENEQHVVSLLIKNPKTTLDQAAGELNLSKRTISRVFKSLQEQKIVERIGANKTGYWKIIK